MDEMTAVSGPQSQAPQGVDSSAPVAGEGPEVFAGMMAAGSASPAAGGSTPNMGAGTGGSIMEAGTSEPSMAAGLAMPNTGVGFDNSGAGTGAPSTDTSLGGVNIGPGMDNPNASAESDEPSAAPQLGEPGTVAPRPNEPNADASTSTSGNDNPIGVKENPTTTSGGTDVEVEDPSASVDSSGELENMRAELEKLRAENERIDFLWERIRELEAELAKPGGGAETGAPNIVSPGADNTGTGTPGNGSPGTGAPGAGTPGTGAPGMGAPGAGTPGAGTPGTGGSGDLTDGAPKQAESLDGKVAFHGENAEEAQKLKETFDGLYESDPDFKEMADGLIERDGSITLTAKDLEGGTAGVGMVGAEGAAIDPASLEDEKVLTHELLHNDGHTHSENNSFDNPELNAEVEKLTDKR